MKLRQIPRKYLLIASHCAAFAVAVLVTVLYLERRGRDRVQVGETFLGYVRLVPYNVAYAWGSREDAAAAVQAYIDNPGMPFIDHPSMVQKAMFFAQSRLAVLGSDPHSTLMRRCKEIDDSCRPETIDRWIKLIRRGRKVPD
jgi:hypothetical protein